MATKGRVFPRLDPTARYWRTRDAARELGSVSIKEFEAWERSRYPDRLGNARSDFESLTVNSVSRPHYDRSRQDWRSNWGHPRDVLFKRVGADGTRWELFDPARHGHFDLAQGPDGEWRVVSLGEHALIEAEAQAQAFAERPPIDSDHDARVAVLRAVHERRGQPAFRARLLEAYGSRCAITRCSAVEVLEAAHVLPYRGDHTNRVDNGLLLRTDLHTLFDCLLLWITPQYEVALAPSLLATEYSELAGKALTLPVSRADRPNPAHLEEHAKRCLAFCGVI